MAAEIRIIKFGELRHLSKLFTSEGVAAKDDGTVYFGYFRGGVLVGIVGVMTMDKNSYRYKSDWVDSNFRGMGVYSQLWDYREEYVAKLISETGTDMEHPPEFTAFCTPMSLGKYLKEGFELVSGTDRKIKYVKRKTMRQ